MNNINHKTNKIKMTTKQRPEKAAAATSTRSTTKPHRTTNNDKGQEQQSKTSKPEPHPSKCADNICFRCNHSGHGPSRCPAVICTHCKYDLKQNQSCWLSHSNKDCPYTAFSPPSTKHTKPNSDPEKPTNLSRRSTIVAFSQTTTASDGSSAVLNDDRHLPSTLLRSSSEDYNSNKAKAEKQRQKESAEQAKRSTVEEAEHEARKSFHSFTSYLLAEGKSIEQAQRLAAKEAEHEARRQREKAAKRERKSVEQVQRLAAEEIENAARQLAHREKVATQQQKINQVEEQQKHLDMVLAAKMRVTPDLPVATNVTIIQHVACQRFP